MSNQHTQPCILRVKPDDATRLEVSVATGKFFIERDAADVPVTRKHDEAETDQHAMRAELPTAHEHVRRLLGQSRDRVCVAYVGNGNAGANRGCVTWVDGSLTAVPVEDPFNHRYDCLVARTDGSVTVREIEFAREDHDVRVLANGTGTLHDITDRVAWLTSGQRLVAQGAPTYLFRIAEQTYDVRHLVQPLFVPLNGDTVFLPNAQLQQGLLRKAVSEPVHIRLEAQVNTDTAIPLTVSNWVHLAESDPAAVRRAQAYLIEHGVINPTANLCDAACLLNTAKHLETLLHTALAGAGYALVEDSRRLQEGEARFVNGHMEIFFRKAIYPHNIFVRWEDSCGFVVFPGKSGRVGITLPEAQELLVELGVKDAILLDNGGDTRLWYRGTYVVPSSEKRERIRSIIAVTASPTSPLGTVSLC